MPKIECIPTTTIAVTDYVPNSTDTVKGGPITPETGTVRVTLSADAFIQSPYTHLEVNGSPFDYVDIPGTGTQTVKVKPNVTYTHTCGGTSTAFNAGRVTSQALWNLPDTSISSMNEEVISFYENWESNFERDGMQIIVLTLEPYLITTKQRVKVGVVLLHFERGRRKVDLTIPNTDKVTITDISPLDPEGFVEHPRYLAVVPHGTPYEVKE